MDRKSCDSELLAVKTSHGFSVTAELVVVVVVVVVVAVVIKVFVYSVQKKYNVRVNTGMVHPSVCTNPM